MTDSPQLTVEIIVKYGNIFAYPGDDFTRLLLPLRNIHVSKGKVREAKCFSPMNIEALARIAEHLGAVLVEKDMMKSDADRMRWDDEKRLFLPKAQTEENKEP